MTRHGFLLRIFDLLDYFEYLDGYLVALLRHNVKLGVTKAVFQLSIAWFSFVDFLTTATRQLIATQNEQLCVTSNTPFIRLLQMVRLAVAMSPYIFRMILCSFVSLRSGLSFGEIPRARQ